MFEVTHRIQVWYICLRFVFDPYGKCWQIYHTWIKVERICYGPQDAFLCQGQFPDGYGWPLPDATQLQFTFPVPCMKYRVLYCLYYKNGYGLWNPNKLTRMSFEMFVWNVCVCVFSLHFQRWIDIHCEVKGSQIGFRSIDSADQCSRSILLVDKLWRLERLDTHLTWWNTNHTNHIGQIDAFDEKFIDCVFHWLFQNVVYQDRDCIYVHWITLIYHMLGVAKTPCNIR